MIHEKITIRLQDSSYEAALYTYILDNSPEIDPNRVRPIVVLCPGGGYEMTSDREAEAIAMQFLAAGCHAAVLRYSVAPARYPEALLQLAQTVRLIRENAEAWHIDTDRIVVQGSSAGGHLAASLAVFWDKPFVAEQIGTTQEWIRPNGLMLSYPVITSGEYAHDGSFEQLLGDAVYSELREKLSLEKQVSENTPATFLWHTATDDAVPVENSILFFTALHKYNIPVEMHIYAEGNHGLGLANEETSNVEGDGIKKECQSWIRLAQQWLLRL